MKIMAQTSGGGSQPVGTSTPGAPAPMKLTSKLRIKNPSLRTLPDYEPSEHRNIHRPTNYYETLVHLVKASIGTGILAMPHAFSNAGYLVGIVGTIVIGVLSTYCLRTMVSVQYELCRRYTKPSMTYMETAQTAFLEGPSCSRNFKYMAIITNVLIITFQVGCCCIYLIFVGKSLKLIIDHHSGHDTSLVLYMCVIMCMLFMTAMISNLKVLAILSFFANISTIGSFCMLVFYILTYGHPTFQNRKQIGTLEHIPLYIGTVVFSMEAVGAVMPLENEMKNPLEFTSAFGVLHMAMFPTVTLYILIGFLGYLNYGDEVLGSITLNLPQGEFLAESCQLMMTFGIFSTNVLVLFITYEILWKSYFQKWIESTPQLMKLRWFICYMIRAILIVITFFLAVLIPNLELLISLIGSLCLASAGIAFPALFNLFTYWEDYVGFGFALFFLWCVLIMLSGLLACLIGVYVSLGEIYVQIWSTF